MSLPIVETPKELKYFIKEYKKCFSKKQYKHFEKLVTGLIVSENKTIQEINDCFGNCNQSSLNRFVNGSWNVDAINKIRINQVKQFTNLSSGVFICDPTFLHKTGKKIEKANYHYSGKTKKKEWGHCLVNNLFYNEKIHFPIKTDIYLRKCDSDNEYKFRTIREIFIEQIDYALNNNLPIKIVMADAGLQADFVSQKIKSRGLKYVIGNRATNKVSVDRNKRISLGEIEKSLAVRDYRRYTINGEKYYIYTLEVYSRSIGKEKLIITYKKGDEENKKIYTTNILDRSDEYLMHLLLKRWKVEELHRDEKQHLGLESYQLRKFGGIQKVVLAVLVAYTLLILNAARQWILHSFRRGLKTIGESCRYFRLIALKGWQWVKRKAKKVSELRRVMNRFVFVKNAKVYVPKGL